MKNRAYVWTVALTIGAFLMLAGGLSAADSPAKVDGTWQLTVESERGTFDQTLAIQQDGGKIKGTLTGRRGENPIEGTVDGNNISFSVKRETPNGTMSIDYTGTVDGESMAGTFKSERFSGKFTAKKGAAANSK